MAKILEKIAWLTRRWNIRFSLFDVYLHDEHSSWGIEIATFLIDNRPHSLLSIIFRLPNKTNVKRFTLDEWDFLFLYYPLWKRCDYLNDRKIWGGKLSFRQEKELLILNKIFK
jgi:hypothetical protein